MLKIKDKESSWKQQEKKNVSLATDEWMQKLAVDFSEETMVFKIIEN